MSPIAQPPGMIAARARVAQIEALLGRPNAARGDGTFASTLAAVSNAAPAASTGAATGARAVEVAAQQLGVPYRWGGTTPDGFDCSGLVQHTYAQLGVDLPRVARDQATAGTAVASLAEARPGDLVAFGSPVDHIGIYAGDGRMVVAPHTGDVVRYETVDAERVTAIRRVVPDDALGSTPYASLFDAAGARHGVPPELLASVASAESGFDPNARSKAGALGLMQLMPGTAASLGVDPLDPASAIDGAARLLASHLQRFGSTELALAAYNAGPGAVDRFDGIPPYAETQSYVRRVLEGATS